MNRPEMMSLLREQVLVFDGATGSNLQLRDLSEDDFEGAEGCNEVLTRTRPDVVRALHESFLEVGCQVVETNTFGATSVVLAEYDLQAEAHALNRQSALLAREVADSFSTPKRPRYVAGSMGPTTKLPSLSHIGFDDLAASYREQAAGLLDGGVDLLVVETCQDLLQIRAAVHGVRQELARAQRRVPVMVSLTLELTGTMLLGTELAAALAALCPLRPDILGLNCATGPLEMKQHMGLLARHSPLPISAMPNAGLPENVGGRTVYPLTPRELARWHRSFVTEDGVQVVGGCCGTTPEHLAEVVRQVADLTPAEREPRWDPAVSSLYSAVPLNQEPKPLLVGERANANGSKKFRKLLKAGDLDGMVALARSQERGGAHALDLCVAYVGRDEVEDARQVVGRFRGEVRLPLVIDSTQSAVMEAALKRCGGRCILNSINLEDGEDRAREVLRLARDFGAAVVALAIDEDGMAREVEQKLAVAERIYRLATEEFGLKAADLIFDMLTFTVCSGDPDLRDAAVQTLEAIEQLKKRLPGVWTILGLSNISFGLRPRSRHALNSVFLHLAVVKGLDMAIVEARKIVPLNRLDPRTRELAEDLLLNRPGEQGDPLGAYMKHFEDVKRVARDPEKDKRPLPVRIHAKVVEGDRTEMELLLAAALTRHTPLEIINEMLIPAMGEVGELFGSGQMQLPFVLLSAEVMKHAVGILEPLMEKSEAANRGTLVLATVKGDVHDIGKNLVDIMLSNNGYRVVNLGIKVPIEEMIRVYTEEKADAIGMSGLLVKSTVVMKENLQELQRRGLNPPVLLGGAALTRRYVNQDLREDYGPRVAYAKDPFEGMDLMRRVTQGELDDQPQRPASETSDVPTLKQMREKRRGALTFSAPPQGLAASDPPEAPFWGTREVELSLDEVLPLINEDVLFRARWQYLKRKLDPQAYHEIIEKQVKPLFARLKEQVLTEGLMKPRGVYGYLPCRSEGNHLVVLDEQGSERVRLELPRQLKPPHHCISDFFRTGEAGGDVLACFVVTVGEEVSRRIAELYAAHSYRDYLHLHGLSVDTAEATAERLHQKIRRELGIHHQDSARVEGLFRKGYQGCRYSFGYPACPDLSNQRLLFDLLDPGRVGVSLTSSLQMVPEQSVSAIVTHHPSARYFAV